MTGNIYTVYGVARSGNLGIGTLITPLFLAHTIKLSKKEKKQLVVLSFLTSVYVKQEMNIFTVLCGTGINKVAVDKTQRNLRFSFFISFP